MWYIDWGVKEIWVGELGLQNVDLADITHIRPATIGDIMKGIQESITLRDLAAICQALHKNVEDVLILVKDTDELDDDARKVAIFGAVEEVRKDRTVRNAIKRERLRVKEEQRIQAAVEKILEQYGIIPGSEENDLAEPDDSRP